MWSVPRFTALCGLAILSLPPCPLPAQEPLPGGQPIPVEITPTQFLVDGRPLQLRSAEIHFTRIPREQWRHRLQLYKALGLNALSLCLLWNDHESTPGQYNWTDDHDAAAFCRLAREEGLWVILRPGPYSCPSSHRGGLPAWLSKDDDLAPRSEDPRFLEPARQWLLEAGRILAPLQASKGGPILLVEVEHDYGAFGNDAGYMGLLREAFLDAGFTVPLATANRPAQLGNALRKDLLLAVDCDHDPASALQALRRFQPSGPPLCGLSLPYPLCGPPENFPHDATAQFLADLEVLLQNKITFQLLESCHESPPGPPAVKESHLCQPPFDETARPTATYRKWRALIAKHLPNSEVLPDPPQPLPLTSFPPITFKECAPLVDNLPPPLAAPAPPPFEQMGMDQGTVLFRARIPAGPPATLRLPVVRDAALLQLNGTVAAEWNNLQPPPSIVLPARPAPIPLDLTAHTGTTLPIGGGDFRARHGLLGAISLQGPGGTAEITPWQIHRFNSPHPALAYQPAESYKGPAFWRGTVPIKQTGDTFLDLENWGVGRVWINGHCAGDFGLPGSPRTLHVPAPALRAGANEIIIFDLRGPTRPILSGNRERPSP